MDFGRVSHRRRLLLEQLLSMMKTATLREYGGQAGSRRCHRWQGRYQPCFCGGLTRAFWIGRTGICSGLEAGRVILVMNHAIMN